MTSSNFKSLDYLAATLLGFAMLLLLRRYAGVSHDSILYMGQAVAQLQPSIFSQDLFFAYGSQSQYSLMPWLLGKSFALATPPVVFMWGTLLSLFFFAAASWFALSALLPEKQRYWAWLGVLCLPGIYGVVHIFGYNEAFLTSRPFSESFCLLTIAGLARRRWLVAGVFFSMAWLLHPLQAAAATLVIWPWLVMQNRRWLHALWAVIPLLLLAAFKIAPFDGLLQSVDPEWLASLRYSKHLYITLWSSNDFKVLGFDVIMLSLAWRALQAPLSKWCAAALVGLLLGIGASLVLVDGLHLVLPTSLQLWRVHWLAHWMSLAALAGLLWQHVRERNPGRALVLLLAAQLAWGETTFGWLAIFAVYFAWPWLMAGQRSRLKPLLAWLIALVLLLLFVNHASNEWKWFAASGYRRELYPIDLRMMIFPGLFILPLLGVMLWERTGNAIRIMLTIAVLLPLTAAASVTWDARKLQDLVFEHAANQPGLFGAPLPHNAQVLWLPETLVGNWLVLHRASYFSDGQLAGQLFNRRTFQTGKARMEKIRLLREADLRCLNLAAAGNKQSDCPIPDSALRAACRPGPTAPPDYLVMPYIQPQRHRGRWDIQDPASGRIVFTYFLYACPDIMADLKAQVSNPR